jgi:hypothetical protein
MPEESETATFGVIKPAQEVRNARTDAPLGGPVAHDHAMDGVGISPLHEIDLLRMHQKIRRATTEAGGTGTFSGVVENCVTPPI